MHDTFLAKEPLEILHFGVGIQNTLIPQLPGVGLLKVTHIAVPGLIFKHLSSDFCHKAHPHSGAKGIAEAKQVRQHRAEAPHDLGVRRGARGHGQLWDADPQRGVDLTPLLARAPDCGHESNSCSMTISSLEHHRIAQGRLSLYNDPDTGLSIPKPCLATASCAMCQQQRKDC